MSALPAPQFGETKWTVMSGPMAGTVRLMQASAFTIGRSPECEFVIISDPKCSRKHAHVEWGAAGPEITSLADNNPVLVNGREIVRSPLKDGDILRLGETEVQFNLTSMPAQIHTPQISVIPPGSYPMPQPGPPIPMRPRPSSGGTRKSKSGGTNPVRMILYTVIGLGVLLFFVDTSKKKKEELTLRTEQQIQADIEAANKLQEAGANAPLKKINDSPTARQAQENYVRGFRDYRKGQYERSLESFQACLALDPSHALCARYLRLAQRRFQEIVQSYMVLGRKYREQNLYRACRAAFQNVIAMVKDANNPVFKEAKANYDACKEMVEGRY
jgi:hypothetical protein